MAMFPLKNVIFMMQNHLSLSASTTQLSVSVSASAPASAPASSSSFTVDYLTSKCGLPLKSAIATSRKLNLNENSIQRFDSVITLFKSHGFDYAHIAKMIQKQPNLLNRYKVEENLKPKLEYLVESGFSGAELHELIVSSPEILRASLNDHIKPSLDFLRTFLGTEERLKLALKRHSRLLSNNLKATVQPNIDLLVKEGVPLDALTNFLVSDPPRMQSKVDRLVAALDVAKRNLNMPATDPMFLRAVLRMASIGVPLWENKLKVFNSLGFSQQQAFSIFKRRPECFGFSEEKLRSKLDFYFNTVKLKKDDIISYSNLLTYSIETRIQPRHNVLKLLLSKKLLQKDAKIAHLFAISEDKFLNKYVAKHLQLVPNLLEMYNNDKAVKKIGLELVHTENMDLKADKEERVRMSLEIVGGSTAPPSLG